MNNCIGIINLDEDESRMGELVANRPLASVPIAARYRVIDFVLSNMTNSGIEDIGIFSKGKSRSLMDHLKNGKPWDLQRKRDGLRLFNFGYSDPAFEDIRNFAENIEYINKSKKEYVILTPSYMICNINYTKVIEAHKKSNNDVTLIYKSINDTEEGFKECDILNINEVGKLLSVEKQPKYTDNLRVSMEMYIMSTELFIDIVLKSIRTGMYRKVKEYINSNLDSLNVGTYEFKGYLGCVNSLDSYYKVNMELLNEEVSSKVFDEKRPIYTKIKDEGPTFYGKDSNVNNSIIANGCCIEGEVINSIIGRRVNVDKGARIENCVILQNTTVGKNSRLINVIANKGSYVPEQIRHIGGDLSPKVIG